jgi:hypothetical protein
VTADLENREIMVLVTIVDVGFRQDGEDADQGDAAHKERRRDRHRDRAGMGIDQQHRCAEPITCDLHRQHMPAMSDTALQYIKR